MKVRLPLLDRLLSSANIELAWTWLCRQRRDFPANADIWDLRFNKVQRLDQMIQAIRQGCFSFTPAFQIEKCDGESLVLWSAMDALVQKMLAQVLADELPVHSVCAHLKGHGGHKKSVNLVHKWLKTRQYQFVCRTDIRGYYAHIDHGQLMAQLARYIDCRIVRDLLAQYLHYSVEFGGTFHTPRQGISRGSPLSPLMAGFQLYEVDCFFAGQPYLRYSRFMDDFIILAKTRWQLRAAVAALNRFFNHFGFGQHPDKTFIGRVERGFDWLGYQFDQNGISSVAVRTLVHHREKIRQLYEQARRLRLSKDETQRRVADYVRRWCSWVVAGLAPPGVHLVDPSFNHG